MKLTKTQVSALLDFRDVYADRDDGYAYPSELGIHTNVVIALHRNGMLERDGNWNGADVDYRITDAGRAALASMENGK